MTWRSSVRFAVCACAVVVVLGCRGAAPRPTDVVKSDSAKDAGDKADAHDGKAASAQQLPSTIPDERPRTLVDVASASPGIRLDLRYATSNNFVGVKIYSAARCLLRAEVAERLARVQVALTEQGYGLKLWDCYRPFAVQELLWERVSDAKYVAKPVRVDGVPSEGSRHNRGAAVDLTLVRADGSEVPMPTDHDDFSVKAHRQGMRWKPEAAANFERLDAAMSAQGFIGLPTEWWHYDAPSWQRYPLLDEPL